MHLQKSTNPACRPCLQMMRSYHLRDLLPLAALDPTLPGPSPSQCQAPCWMTPACTSFPCIRVPSQLPRMSICQPRAVEAQMVCKAFCLSSAMFSGYHYPEVHTSHPTLLVAPQAPHNCKNQLLIAHGQEDHATWQPLPFNFWL